MNPVLKIVSLKSPQIYIMEWDNDKGMVLSGLIAIIATGLGIYFTYQNAYAAGLAQKKLQTGIDSSNFLAGSTNQIAGSTNSEVLELKSQNSELKKQIAYLTDANDILEANITGGNSSCYLIIIPRREKGIAEVFLGQRGKYPLREVDIELINSLDGTKFERHFSIIKVTNNNRFLGTVPFSLSNGGTHYSIFISTFNNTWSQQVNCEPSTNKKMGLNVYSVYRIYHITRNAKYEYEYKFQEQGCFTCESDTRGNPYVLGKWNWGNSVKHLTEFGLIERSFK